MDKAHNGETLRKTLLKTIKDLVENDPDNFQSGVILGKVERELNLRERDDVSEQQALLTFWHDLFRTGYLSWGYNIDNVESPHCHLTEKGRKWLEHFSRDPANPDAERLRWIGTDLRQGSGGQRHKRRPGQRPAPLDPHQDGPPAV